MQPDHEDRDPQDGRREPAGLHQDLDRLGVAARTSGRAAAPALSWIERRAGQRRQRRRLVGSALVAVMTVAGVAGAFAATAHRDRPQVVATSADGRPGGAQVPPDGRPGSGPPASSDGPDGSGGLTLPDGGQARSGIAPSPGPGPFRPCARQELAGEVRADYTVSDPAVADRLEALTARYGATPGILAVVPGVSGKVYLVVDWTVEAATRRLTRDEGVTVVPSCVTSTDMEDLRRVAETDQLGESRYARVGYDPYGDVIRIDTNVSEDQVLTFLGQAGLEGTMIGVDVIVHYDAGSGVTRLGG